MGLAGTTAAAAADLPLVTKAPPPVAPSWAGFYLGVHGGYAWGQNDFREYLNEYAPYPVRNGFDSRGAIVGGHAGYNWQYGRAVAGVELDFSAADVSGSSATTTWTSIFGSGPYSADRSDRLKYLGTSRARLGWLAGANVLLYGTGGLAWERVEETEHFAAPTYNSVRTTPFDRFGWVAGVGIEVTPFGPNWVARLEYLHYDFGAVQATATRASSSSPTLTDHAGHQRFDLLRAGLSYKFGAPSGPMAAYAAVTPAVAASWAGFYLGVHGGYGWGKDDFIRMQLLNPRIDMTGPKLSGGVYGGHAGHNWQFDRAVAGWELDFGSGNIGGSSQVQYTVGQNIYTRTLTDKVEVLGSLRGRLGWLPTESVLLYGTAGLGWERLGITTDRTNVAAAGSWTSSTYSPTDRFGWVAGVGAEAMLPGGNWIGRIEYLHYGFGTINESYRQDGPGVVPYADQSGHHDLDVVRAGLSYRFAEPAAMAPVAQANASLAPMSSWAGFYLGAHAGYGRYNDDFTNVNPYTGVHAGGVRPSGWVGGGHAGYNWQYGRAVAGVEGDLSSADVKGTSTPVTEIMGGTEATRTLEDRTKYVGTARARLGWAPADRVLLYATAGAAWGRVERSQTYTSINGANVNTAGTTTPADHFGGVIGAGVEWMPFGPNWVGRLEYLHYDFGKVPGQTVTSNVPGAVTYSARQGRQTMDLVRLGVSYKFDSAAPN
ncbi:MAG: porin family protein [Bradyrhizobium sp.]|uniref:outer membrane protein n=1 Tax=Bradyrhizobium sp. TaxID=376 RepID=UPI0025BE3AAE|nr:outer membrane beta-barrel protein [Bradyrhizobium sp.]MBI5260473.1 porin family protein [Bradyrhizobium sp.]